MKDIKQFKKGDPLSAKLFNDRILHELRRLQNMKGGTGVKVVHTANGVLLSMDKGITTIDDKYRAHTEYNQSTQVQRLGDLRRGDLMDIWRIRATLDQDPKTPVTTAQSADDVLYRIMWLIDRNFGGGGRGGDGGWVTDAARPGLDKTKIYEPHEVPTPSVRIGQIGDIVILTDDDIIATTADGDIWTYTNIRHDAHFHMDASRDGRIYFTTTPPGQEPSGFPIKGEMVGDPTVANSAYSQLKKESVEWRPQWKLPVYDVPGVINDPAESGYRFPPLRRVPNSTVMAYAFGTAGRKEGWSAHYQIQYKIPTYGLGYLIKYSANNPTGGQQDAFMENYWKTANAGGDISIAGLAPANFNLPVPAGATETDIQYAWVGFIPETSVSDFSLAIIGLFARDPADVADTLANRLLITEVKMLPMIVVVPP